MLDVSTRVQCSPPDRRAPRKTWEQLRRDCCYSEHASEKVVWQITDRCHLHCAYCFTPSRSRKDLSVPHACAVLRGVLDAHPQKRRLLLAGREPLLYPGLTEVISAARGMGFRCSLSTSGELLGPRLADALVGAGLSKINLTINAPDGRIHEATRGGSSLTRVQDAVRSASRAGLVVRVNITVTPVTLGSLASTMEHIAELGVTKISVGLLHPQWSDYSPSGAYSRMESQVKKAVVPRSWLASNLRVVVPNLQGPCRETTGCPVRQGLISVLPDGSVVGCNIFPAVAPVSIGGGGDENE
jgi:MoaA/NifB/PqqE/SkfB family radical SAM enzyme